MVTLPRYARSVKRRNRPPLHVRRGDITRFSDAQLIERAEAVRYFEQPLLTELARRLRRALDQLAIERGAR